jgi:cell volume regulation protein A
MLPIEVFCLAVAILLLVSIFSSKLANKFGIPSLLFFLLIGWLMGMFGGIQFNNPITAKFIADFALIFILFTGGLDTQWKEIRPILWTGLKLATIGVLLTMLILGTFAWFILGSYHTFSIGLEGISFTKALLLAAIVSSTDASAVFSVLRSGSVKLQGNLKPILELESSSNDPMAVLLTTTIINLLTGETPAIGNSIIFLILQLVMGVTFGYGAGLLIIWLINHLKLDNQGLYPIESIALALLTYSLTTFFGGNGFLSVYVAGIVMGNKSFIYKEEIRNFHDSFAWLMQIIMFLTLGMLSIPYQAKLSALASVAVVISLFLIFVARPASIFISLIGSKISVQEKLFISWVGLRGSVPIILATFPLAINMEQGGEIFVVVSFIVVLSVIIQGLTLNKVASKLGLVVQE